MLAREYSETVTFLEPQFSTGTLLIDVRTRTLLDKNAIQNMLQKHVSAEWGEVDGRQQTTNNETLSSSWLKRQLVSCYKQGKFFFYVVTRDDRIETLIVIAEELGQIGSQIGFSHVRMSHPGIEEIGADPHFLSESGC